MGYFANGMAGRKVLNVFLGAALVLLSVAPPITAQAGTTNGKTKRPTIQANQNPTQTAPEAIIQHYPGDFNPTAIIHLYPEGQHVDRGIMEPTPTVINQQATTVINQQATAAKGQKAPTAQRKKQARLIPVTLGPGEANRTDTTEFYWERDGSLNAVSDSARIVLYLPPPAERNGQLILVCPGGGYNEIMFRSEGVYAAKSLVPKGFAVGIICYRMPTGDGAIPLTDVQNAFRYCRHHAGEWGIRQIGIMGMSAGGHLAAMASTQYTDAVTRPDFTILFYPVVSADPGLAHRGSFRRLTGLDPRWIAAGSEALAQRGIETPRGTAPTGQAPASAPQAKAPAAPTFQPTATDSLAQAIALLDYYSPDRHITPDTPPALLFHSIDDGVNPENSLRYYERLIAAGVPAELHIFPSGGHGWGFNTMETAGRDKLEPYRPVFFAALFAFLDGLR